jgi:two-component system, NarL family, nitrate/nitrite sensor histidine kinase NarX
MQKSIRTIRWVTFSALLVTAAAFLFPFIDWTSSSSIVAGFLIVLAAAMLTWALETWLKFLLENIDFRKSSQIENSGTLSDLESTLLLDTSKAFLAARTQKDVLEIVMKTGLNFLGAAGASFTSFEEWKSPLSIRSIGDVPSGVYDEWINRLSHPATRQACRKCKSREAGAGCILNQDISNPYMKVFCVPISEGQREYGLINFFFHFPAEIGDSKRKFLHALSDQSASALRSIRLWEQGNAPLHYLESSIARKDFSCYLENLSNKIANELHYKSAFYWVPESSEDALASAFLDNSVGELDFMEDSLIQELWLVIMESRQPFTRKAVTTKNREKIGIMVIPIAEPTEIPIGMMICTIEDYKHVTIQNVPLLQVIAQDIAMILRSFRFTNQLEYRVSKQERFNLAREIHDGLAQNLAYLKIQTSQMLNDFNTGNMERLEASLSDSYQTISNAYLDVRREIDDLRFEADADTREWLKKIASGFQKETGIVVDVSRLKMDAKLPIVVQSQLIRIVQEALNNVRKHAQAENVAIIGEVHDGELVIEVSDDGLGFEPDQINTESRFGLVGMRERTELIGGDFQIVSKHKSGTIVRVTVPLKTPHENEVQD